MSRGRITVAELAEEADLDLDEAIVTLWDAGFEEVKDPADAIPARRIDQAKRALGVATPRELTTPRYWEHVLAIDHDAFIRILTDVGIRMSPHARRLPKGAIGKLKRVARDRLGNVDIAPPPPIEDKSARLPPLIWEHVGHQQPLRQLTVDEVVGIHECLEEDFAETNDPIVPPGVRDRNLLESAVFRPTTSLGDVAKYPTVEMAGAALLHSLVLNHPFFNGNKRTALVAMMVFLDENGFTATCEEDQLFRLVLLVAQHRLVPRGEDDRADREVLEVARWLKGNTRRVEHGERILKWIRMRRILAAFSCWTDFEGGVGNRINVHREVTVARRFGRSRSIVLTSKLYYGGEGSEVERNTVSKLRKDLQLDDEHGVDSQSFYNMEVRAAADFIATYRKTLDRLARL